MISFRLLSALLAVSSVSAHGVIREVTLDGKTFPGPDPISEDTANVAISPVRKIVNTSNGPAAGDLTSSNLACGVNARKAKVTADVTAGSTITTHWDDTWPHVAGPIITYLGKCKGDCTDADATKIDFFKIDEVAFKDDGVTWVQADIHDKKDFAVTLPKNIPNGQYIFRQEIFALHLAQSEGGAELYPSCTQINVKGGSGSSLPSETVKFPGAYTAKDPGLLVDIYNLKKGAYVMPGPKMTFPSRLQGAVGSTASSSSGGSSSSGDDTTTDDSASTTDDSTAQDDNTSDDADCTEDDGTADDETSADDGTEDDGDDETCSDEGDSSDDTSSPDTVKGDLAISGSNAPPVGNITVVDTSASTTVTTSEAAPTVASSGSALDTGNKAIELNNKFATMDASGSCTSGEVACIGKLFAKCDHEKWVTWSCGGTSQCYAVPDAGSLSVVITCDTTDDYMRRLQATGAAPTKARMVKRHGHRRLHLEANTF